MKKLLKSKKGITLIALVITIIVLLILAGVTVATLTGENGLLSKAQLAKERTAEGEQDERDKLSSYENELSNYGTWERTGGSGTITISQDEWNKVEKVETISTTKLCYGNTTLSYDFSKYKRLRCYAFLCDGVTIFEVDLATINAPSSVSELNNDTLSRYSGGSVISRTLGDLDLLFMCNVNVNAEKSVLTLDKIGWSNGTSYNDRIASGRENEYYIYKVEGIYN